MLTIRFLGHAAFTFSDGSHEVLVDPFLTDNPVAAAKPDDLSPDAILLTHGHNDHLGDAVPIAKRANATIVAPFELAVFCERQGCVTHPMHIGGAHTFDFGRVKFVPAWHGSAFIGDDIVYTGNPTGIILTMGGISVYHAGDTGLFGDMRLIGERETPDVALLPIGDNFTMGVEDAEQAARWVGARRVIPMHYNTFDLISADPQDLARRLEGSGIEVLPLAPGESLQV
jgi:L-ascorbate metabolism protein UlaG (beta-lactamase superfamily)